MYIEPFLGEVSSGGGGGGGGGALFFSYVGLGPSSTVHQKKYQEFQAPKNNI